MTRQVPVKYPAPTSSTRWAVLAWTDIPSKILPGMVYLRRLRLVQTPWASLYLHWIYEKDTDRALHDHPWWFGSLIVRGGYIERMSTEPWNALVEPARRLWDRGSWHTMSTREAHQIVDVLPGTVTLIWTGPKRRTWGFWVPNRVEPLTNRWVPWREYVDEQQERLVDLVRKVPR